jgi:esterase
MIRNWLVLGCREEFSQTIYIAHGILGSAQNWRSFALKWSSKRPETRFVLFDIRNHGRSGPGSDPNTVNACAKDLVKLSQEVGPPDILVGHSFGGKVVLAYLDFCKVTPDQVWLLDSAVGKLDISDGKIPEVMRLIQHIKKIPLPLATRKELIPILMASGFTKDLSRWMTTNLKKEKGGYIWRFHLGGIESLLMDYFDLDLWYLVELPQMSTIYILRAMQSERWTEALVERVKKSYARYVELNDSDHWVHIDNPDGLMDIFLRDAL